MTDPIPSPRSHDATTEPHESNHHGWGGPCKGCAPCPIHGDDCPKAIPSPRSPQPDPLTPEELARVRRHVEAEPWNLPDRINTIRDFTRRFLDTLDDLHSMIGHEHCEPDCEVRAAGEALDNPPSTPIPSPDTDLRAAVAAFFDGRRRRAPAAEMLRLTAAMGDALNASSSESTETPGTEYRPTHTRGEPLFDLDEIEMRWASQWNESDDGEVRAWRSDVAALIGEVHRLRRVSNGYFEEMVRRTPGSESTETLDAAPERPTGEGR